VTLHKKPRPLPPARLRGAPERGREEAAVNGKGTGCGKVRSKEGGKRHG